MGNYRDYEGRGTSRSRGKSRGRGAGSQRGASGRSTSGRSSAGNSGRSGSYRRKKKNNSMAPLIGGGLAVAVFAVGAFAFKDVLFNEKNTETEPVLEESTAAFDPNVIQENVYLDYSALVPGAELLNLKGMNQQQLLDKLKGSYNWQLVVKNGNPNLDKFKMPSIPEQTESSGSGNAASQDNEGTEEIVKVENPLESVTIHPEKAEYAIPDLIAEKLEALVPKIFEDYQAKSPVTVTVESTAENESEAKKSLFSFSSKKETESSTEAESSTGEIRADYLLELPDYSEQLRDVASQLAIVWDMAPENGDITSFDAASGEFVFGGTVDGYKMNAEATAAKLIEAVQNRNYDSSITADGEKVTASAASIKGQYKTMVTYTTNTTANSVRNQNVKLAAQAVNGTVLKPGEEFSFNDVVGKRTVEKGYGAAAAYNSGEVVQEVGGGVCQVSSTLYNAVFRAGLTTTYRRSHTFAPSYVRPGADATVSWGGPDYKFVNNSKHAIGIRAWYKDQTCTVQIYGIPVLPEGESWDLITEKVEDLPLPEPQIITPEQGSESAGSTGSRWVAYKVIKKNGTEEKVQDHKVTYKGHTPKKYAESLQQQSESESSEGESVSAAEEGSESTKAAEPTKESTAAEAPVSTEPAEIAAHPGADSDTVSEHAAPAAPGGDSENVDVIPGGPGD